MAKEHFEIYSCGLSYMSLCTNIKDRDEILKRANHIPVNQGGDPIWNFSKDEAFAAGGPNPGPCEENRGRTHYLMEC